MVAILRGSVRRRARWLICGGAINRTRVGTPSRVTMDDGVNKLVKSKFCVGDHDELTLVPAVAADE